MLSIDQFDIKALLRVYIDGPTPPKPTLMNNLPAAELRSCIADWIPSKIRKTVLHNNSISPYPQKYMIVS